MNLTIPELEERVAGLFQPDTLLAPQYFEERTPKTYLGADRRLMLAILQDAVVCFQENVAARDVRKRTLFRDAEEWILDDRREWIFSFKNICDALSLDPDYVREGLLRWKARKLGGSRSQNSQLC